MRTPDTLLALVDHGIIDEVVRPLMSGKEAHIYLVLSGGEQRVAKIYKEAQNRTFQNRADYTEGRRVRNSRDQRAMGTRSRHGRAQNEAAWKSAEVDMIYRLRDAGVRVPTPYHFIDGVLLMELVTDAEGFPAPRLGDIVFTPEEATAIFEQLLAEVVRMLCAGVVHGDLSDFNVLMTATGPVVIDFPQAVDASSNQNARKLLLRDVDNLHRFHAKFAPEKPALPYAQEMWDLYQRSALTPDTRLTGRFRAAEKAVKADAVLDLIADAERDERRKRERLGLSMRGVDGGGNPRGDRPAARARFEGPAARVEGTLARSAEHGAPRQPQQARPEVRDGRPEARPEHARRDQPRHEQRPARANSGSPQHTGDSRARPEFTPARPERTNARPEFAPSRPERTNARPEFTPARPERTNARPEFAPARPERTNARPEFAPARPERTNARPEFTPARPERTNARPEFTPARPERTNARPEFANDRPRDAWQPARQAARPASAAQEDARSPERNRPPERAQGFRTEDSWQRFARKPEQREPAHDRQAAAPRQEAPRRHDDPRRQDDPRRAPSEHAAQPRRDAPEPSTDPDFRRSRR